MVYMGVEVTAGSRMYGDGVKAVVVIVYPTNLPLQMDSDVSLM